MKFTFSTHSYILRFREQICAWICVMGYTFFFFRMALQNLCCEAWA